MIRISIIEIKILDPQLLNISSNILTLSIEHIQDLLHLRFFKVSWQQFTIAPEKEKNGPSPVKESLFSQTANQHLKRFLQQLLPPNWFGIALKEVRSQMKLTLAWVGSHKGVKGMRRQTIWPVKVSQGNSLWVHLSTPPNHKSESRKWWQNHQNKDRQSS